MKASTLFRTGSSSPDSATAPNLVVMHLSGSRRGATEKLAGERLRIGTAANAEIHFPVDREPAVSSHHATLHRAGVNYRVQAEPEQAVWVNGEPVKSMLLTSGDSLQIGKGGPLLRVRLYQDGTRAYKSVAQTFSDCVDCARHGGKTPLDRAAIFLTTTPKELATQTSPWFRWSVLVFLVLSAISTAGLTLRSLQLEERLAGERARFAETSERLAALEARADASRRVIANATKSVVFLQGAYRFLDSESRKPLRLLGLDPDGKPLLNAAGEPFVSPEGKGPIVESFFTGTAFVASDDGLLLTNRHVAVPWEADEAAQTLTAQGLIPVVHRFVGYLAGVKEPFAVELGLASEDADIAVLRGSAVTGRVSALTLSNTPPRPGDEVIVLGYPAGMRALLARAGATFVEELSSEADVDFWSVARRLSEQGRIGPLATRGIVGQVSREAVVYDAETTSGGSGGPVVGLDGRVVAINTAILPEFGGSNLGVPAEHARKLLAAARTDSQ